MIPFPDIPVRLPDEQTMQDVYEKIKTPYKYGAVMKFDTALCDSPTVFRYRDAWYMSFIKIDKEVTSSGYESHLARSKDLLHWEYLYPTLRRRDDDTWDAKQIAAYAAFVENAWEGQYRLQKVGGAYHMAYLGGALNGYETAPLSMGQCRVGEVTDPATYHRRESAVLTPFDADVRRGENGCIFKAYMFCDEAQVLGYPYVNVYNASGLEYRKESIFLAVSEDGEHWQRMGETPILWDDSEAGDVHICGDPQILKIGELYVMVYFVLKGKRAFDMFACSYDLIHWTKWQGKPLVESEYAWEDKYAHKPWLVVDGGVVYHFYCACNTCGERFIALACSRDMQNT